MHRTGRHWTWQDTTHIVTLTVYLQADGSYRASLYSATPGKAAHRAVALSAGTQKADLAPPALDALLEAAGDALDRFYAGTLD